MLTTILPKLGPERDAINAEYLFECSKEKTRYDKAMVIVAERHATQLQAHQPDSLSYSATVIRQREELALSQQIHQGRIGDFRLRRDKRLRELDGLGGISPC